MEKWKASRDSLQQRAVGAIPPAFIRPLHIHPSIHLYWASLECPTEWRRNRRWQKDGLDTSHSILLSNKNIISLFLWSYGYRLVYTHYTLYLLSKNTHKTSLIASNTIHLFRQEISSSSHHPPCRSPPWCQFVRYDHLFLPLIP